MFDEQLLMFQKYFQSPGSHPPHGFFGPNSINASDYAKYGAPASSGQPGGAQAAIQAAAQSAYSQWAGYYGGSDYTKAASATAATSAAGMDPVSQAWAAYYQQYYGQQPAAGAVDSTTASATSATSTTASASASTGTDYSQAWVDYYRSMGMYAEAEAIIKQTQQVSSQT